MEKTVQTIAGPFDRKRYKSLCRLLADSDKQDMNDDELVLFEGQDLLIGFGKQLRNHLDLTFAQRGHGGL